MNPGPAPRPPTDRPRLYYTPVTHGVPGNSSQLSLSSPSMRPAVSTGFTESSPYHARSRAINAEPDKVKEGPARVKDGLLWKNRYLVLWRDRLEIKKGGEGKVTISLRLDSVTGVSRCENIPMSVEIIRVANPPGPGTTNPIAMRELPQKSLYCQLKSDDDLYEWIDAIYSRCPSMGGVSNPTNFSHRVHVGFDPVNGSFIGLPPEWAKLLTTSAITKEDYKNHPQAVIEVLDFYSKVQERSERPLQYPSLTPTPPVTTNQNMQLGHGGGGTTIAPRRPSPPINQFHSNYAPAIRFNQNHSPPSRNGTPAGQRNVSSPESANLFPLKSALDAEMHAAMNAEARRIKEAKERERAKASEEEQNRRDQEAFNAAIPKTRVPMAKQELGGYGGGGDDPANRFNPTRSAPQAPGVDRLKQAPQGSLRQPSTGRHGPDAVNGSVRDAPRAPFAQRTPGSRDHSPTTPGSLRSPPRTEQNQRQPSPAPQPANAVRTQPTATPHLLSNHNIPPLSSSTPRTRDPPTSGGDIPAMAERAGNPPPTESKPLEVRTREPTGAPNGNQPKLTEGQKQAANALTNKSPNARREKEARMSTMSESEVMEKLKQVVSPDDPQLSYSKQKKIGQGASGSVYVARIHEDAVSAVARKINRVHGGRAQVAIKQMDLRNQPRKELIVNEIIVMKESQHPNIVNFLDSFLQEGNNELWVVMEYMEGGALTDVIDNNQNIGEPQISTICNE
ncbi:MAG: hypothetical protein Q9190_008056, partial [Brigantiaea leucoxantha]